MSKTLRAIGLATALLACSRSEPPTQEESKPDYAATKILEYATKKLLDPTAIESKGFERVRCGFHCAIIDYHNHRIWVDYGCDGGWNNVGKMPVGDELYILNENGRRVLRLLATKNDHSKNFLSLEEALITGFARSRSTGRLQKF